MSQYNYTQNDSSNSYGSQRNINSSTNMAQPQQQQQQRGLATSNGNGLSNGLYHNSNQQNTMTNGYTHNGFQPHVNGYHNPYGATTRPQALEAQASSQFRNGYSPPLPAYSHSPNNLDENIPQRYEDNVNGTSPQYSAAAYDVRQGHPYQWMNSNPLVMHSTTALDPRTNDFSQPAARRTPSQVSI